MKKALILIIFIFSCAMCRAEDISLTLNEAVEIALRDNRGILLKSEDVKSAKEVIKEAQAGFYPSLTFTGNASNVSGYYSKDDVTQNTTQIGIKQYLYKGSKTINSVAQSKHKLGVSEALLDKAKLETVLNVQKAFYTLLLANEFSGLNKAIFDNTKEHFTVYLARYENGEASETDILRIRESLSSVEKAYETSLNQAKSAEAILKNLLYLDEDVIIKPEGAFVYQPKEVAYDEAFLKAVGKRPEIKQYAAQQEADKKAIEIAKADARPSVYASWDYYSNSHASGTTRKGRNDHDIMGVTVTWPIFDGWATRHKVEQAIIDLKTTQILREKTVKDIALELKNAYLDLKTAISEIKSSQSEVDFYKNIFSGIQDKYKAGIASSTDLNDADLSYSVSIFNQKQAIYDYIVAKAEFDKAMGE